MDTPTPSAASSGETPEQQDIRENKDIAAFSYLWVMSVVIYFLRRNSPFVRFHAKQAMILFAVSIPLWFIPYIGRLLDLIVFGGMVLGFMAAAQGEKRDVPLVGKLSRREITLRQAWQEIVGYVGRALKALARMKKTEKKPVTPRVDAAKKASNDASTAVVASAVIDPSPSASAGAPPASADASSSASSSSSFDASSSAGADAGSSSS